MVPGCVTVGCGTEHEGSISLTARVEQHHSVSPPRFRARRMPPSDNDRAVLTYVIDFDPDAHSSVLIHAFVGEGEGNVKAKASGSMRTDACTTCCRRGGYLAAMHSSSSAVVRETLALALACWTLPCTPLIVFSVFHADACCTWFRNPSLLLSPPLSACSRLMSFLSRQARRTWYAADRGSYSREPFCCTCSR